MEPIFVAQPPCPFPSFPGRQKLRYVDFSPRNGSLLKAGRHGPEVPSGLLLDL